MGRNGHGPQSGPRAQWAARAGGPSGPSEPQRTGRRPQRLRAARWRPGGGPGARRGAPLRAARGPRAEGGGRRARNGRAAARWGAAYLGLGPARPAGGARMYGTAPQRAGPVGGGGAGRRVVVVAGVRVRDPDRRRRALRRRATAALPLPDACPAGGAARDWLRARGRRVAPPGLRPPGGPVSAGATRVGSLLAAGCWVWVPLQERDPDRNALLGVRTGFSGSSRDKDRRSGPLHGLKGRGPSSRSSS